MVPAIVSTAGARSERDRKVARVLWAILVANVTVAILKLVLGLSIGSVAVWADGLHSLLDGTSNVVGLVGIALASKPPDREHPYGHRRFETIAATLIGLLIAAGLVTILASVARSVITGTSEARPTPLAAALIAVTLVVNLVVSRVEASRGRALKSSLLTADAAHTASDALASLVVLVSFAGVAIGWPWADWVAALAVSALIARAAYLVLRENLGVLLDRARLDAARVQEVAQSVEGVRVAHDVRSRGLADHVQLDLHLHLDGAVALSTAHAVAERVSAALYEAFPEVTDVLIQIEPDEHATAAPGGEER
jgi:cation diffusion facilitator family transporter